MDTFENKLPDDRQDTPGEQVPEAEVTHAVPEEAAAQPEICIAEDAPQEAVTEEAPQEECTTEEAPPEEIPAASDPEPAAPHSASPFADSPYVTAIPQQPKEKAPHKPMSRFSKIVLGAVLILCVIIGACLTVGLAVNSYWRYQVQQIQESMDSKLADMEAKLNRVGPGTSSGIPVTPGEGLTPAQVYAQNVQSVVMIYNKLGALGQSGTSTGSGFILSENGYVVTNHHVIEGNGTLSVVTSDGTSYSARLVGSDKTNDVALLKVEATGLQAVTLGSSTELIVGDQVVAIGNPLGELTSTLTVGYISAKERDVNTDGFAINMLQTDASINSGNSGGPLFNMRGEVVGITTAKYSGTSSSGATIEGIGFAIPIDDVSDLLDDLVNLGYISGAYLGVSVSDMDPVAANYYSLPMGAYVQEVTEGYAAHRAGVCPKDIIVDLGGTAVENVNDLTRALRGFAAGDKTTITVYRSGQKLELEIVLDPKPAQ